MMIMCGSDGGDDVVVDDGDGHTKDNGDENINFFFNNKE